jgi:hypothetical protein
VGNAVPQLAVLTLVGLVACAAPRPPAPVPGTHERFPDTRVSLRLPEGFHHDPALPGFASPDERTALFVNELPGSVYGTLRSFSAEAFAREGMRLHGHERVTVDGWPARLYYATQPGRPVTLSRWVLVFGDSRTSVVLTAVTPEPERETWEALLTDALLSARWHR